MLTNQNVFEVFHWHAQYAMIADLKDPAVSVSDFLSRQKPYKLGTVRVKCSFGFPIVQKDLSYTRLIEKNSSTVEKTGSSQTARPNTCTAARQWALILFGRLSDRFSKSSHIYPSFQSWFMHWSFNIICSPRDHLAGIYFHLFNHCRKITTMFFSGSS